MENAMQISFSLKMKDIVTLGWLCGWCMLLSLAVGSQLEAEPRAALMFGLITAAWTVAAYPVFKWRNR